MDVVHVDRAEQTPFAQSVAVGGFDLPHPTARARPVRRAGLLGQASSRGSAFSSRLPGVGVDIVDRGHLPAPAGEGDGVAPGSASRVQNAAGGKRIGALCDRLQFGRGFVRIHGVNPIRYSRS